MKVYVITECVDDETRIHGIFSDYDDSLRAGEDLAEVIGCEVKRILRPCLKPLHHRSLARWGNSEGDYIKIQEMEVIAEYEK